MEEMLGDLAVSAAEQESNSSFPSQLFQAQLQSCIQRRRVLGGGQKMAPIRGIWFHCRLMFCLASSLKCT